MKRFPYGHNQKVTIMSTPNVRTVSRPSRSIVLAAAAGAAVGLLAAASQAMAQYRVGADGHANDVNNRIGSGGYNSASDASYRSGAYNGQIVTGNVSGLAYFHSSDNGEFDSSVFQGGVNSGSVNSFNQISAPVNYSARSTGQPVYTPYYSSQTYVGNKPPDLSSINGGNGYVPTQTQSALTPNPADLRLQTLNTSPLDQLGSNLPPPGAVDQPGPVNNLGAQGIYAQSSLYGAKQAQYGDQSDDSLFSQRYGGQRPGSMPKMATDAIIKMRTEVQQSSTTADQKDTDGGANADLNKMNNPGVLPPDSVNGQLGQPGQPGAPGTVSGTQVTGATVKPQTVASSVNAASYGSQQDKLMLTPAQQSKQITELERRFSINKPKPTAQEQANQNNRIILAVRKAEADKKAALLKGGPDVDADKPKDPAAEVAAGAVAAPAGKGGIATTDHPQPTGKTDLPSVVREPGAEPVANPDQPFVITSLASGIKAAGLSKLLRDAEGQMRAGQFGQSVDTYDTAAEVAPNNPFVPLGRGFAELGASYYGKAEADLTRAILTEPALLAAQYDLKGFLGADRLKFVQKDLADIGTTEQTARPYLLMAFIDHNTGADDTTVTAKDLDTAASRGANPKLVEVMREAWNLKSADAK